MIKKIGIIVTLIFVLLFIGLKYRWKPVKWGLSPISAYQSVMSHEGIIVHYEDAGFYYWNGMKKENVTLIGRVPFYEFKTDTLFANTFFLKGKIQKELSDFYRETVFDVEDWKIVFPIRRQYNLSYQDGRFFYPELYIDEFDVTNNDFQIIHHTEKVISNYEAMYFHIQFPEEYCIVTPENDDGIIKWHVVTEYDIQNGIRTVDEAQIELVGSNLPEEKLKQIVFFDDEFSPEYSNLFLIKGKRLVKKFQVEDWKVVTPFSVEQHGWCYYLDGLLDVPELDLGIHL